MYPHYSSFLLQRDEYEMPIPLHNGRNYIAINAVTQKIISPLATAHYANCLSRKQRVVVNPAAMALIETSSNVVPLCMLSSPR